MAKFIKNTSITVCALVSGAGFAWAEPSVQLAAGVEFETGSYGQAEDTDILEVPFSLRVRNGNWSFRASVPFVSVEGPGGVVPAEDNSGRGSSNSGSGSSGSGGGGGSSSAGVSESGIGDVALSATYTHELSDSMYVDLTGRATLPTGDEEKDLGVGETDYGISAELGRDVGGTGMYAMAGYKVRGGDVRDDGAQAAIGAYGKLFDGNATGIELNWAEASVAGDDDPASAIAFTSFKLTEKVKMSLYAETGLSDSAPDFGAGVSFSWRTNFRRPFQRN